MSAASSSTDSKRSIIIGIAVGVAATVIGGLILVALTSIRDMPPHQGAFIKRGRFGYVEIPIHLDGESIGARFSDAPVTNDSRPTIVIWEPQMRMDSLTLHEEIGAIGIALGYGYYDGKVFPGVDEVIIRGGAEEAGIMPGDLIIALDGISTENFDLDNFRALALGPAGSKIDVTVIRNETRRDFTVVRIPTGDNTRGRIPFEVFPNDELLELTPSENLTCMTNLLS